MGSRLQSKVEDRERAEGLITVRRIDALTSKLPVLVSGQHRLVIVHEYHDGVVTMALEVQP